MTKQFDEYFEHAAIRQRDKIALTVDGRWATDAALQDDASTTESALRDLGIAASAGVAVDAERSVHAVASAVGLLKAGCGLACSRHTITTDALEAQVCDCGASALIASRSVALRAAPRHHAQPRRAWPPLSEHIACCVIDGAPHTANTDTPHAATISYTSGSTGDSKGRRVTHPNTIAAFRSVCGDLANREQDVMLRFSPGLSDDALVVRPWPAICRWRNTGDVNKRATPSSAQEASVKRVCS